jgi:hypothetical protein
MQNQQQTANKNPNLAYRNPTITKIRPGDNSPGLWAWRQTAIDGELLLLKIDALRLHVVDGGSDLLQLEVDALHLHAVDQRR